MNSLDRADQTMKDLRKRRKSTGSVIAEAPLVLWVLFFAFVFPLINMTTTFIRLTLLYAASHNSCIWAARGRTFQAIINGDPSAVYLAQTGAEAVITKFSGIHLANLNVAILITDVNTDKQTISTKPLGQPPDVSNNAYQIQVSATGLADPLFYMPLPVKIAGLNAPLAVQLVDRQYFENPQGLIY
jgi:hypothetical protein